MTGSIWQLLGIEPTRDGAAIKRAYAQRLKDTRPEDDPEGFQHLRAAYELALRRCDAEPSPPLVTLPLLEPRRPEALQDVPPPRLTSLMWALRPGPAEVPAHKPFRPYEDVFSWPLKPPPPLEGLPRRLLDLRVCLLPISEANETERLRILARALELVPVGSVMQQSEAERQLAAMLVSSAPRSNVLLEPAIKALRWQQQEKALEPEPLIEALLAHWHRTTLTSLKSGEDPDSEAFSSLCRSGTWWSRAWRTQRFGAPELRLLERLRFDHPALLTELNPEEVRWWDRFASPSLAPPRRTLPPWLFWALVASGLLKLIVALSALK